MKLLKQLVRTKTDIIMQPSELMQCYHASGNQLAT